MPVSKGPNVDSSQHAARRRRRVTMPRSGITGYPGRTIRTAILVLSIAALLAPVYVRPAAAVPGRVTQFTLPTRNSGPSGITAGLDRSVWFTEAATNRIGRLAFDGG